jgi:hypothetical protein
LIFKPSNIKPENFTFPAGESIEVTWKNNGDSMVAYEVVVRKIVDNTIAFTSGKVVSYITKYIIPAGSLINGNEYTYVVTVYNNINEFVSSSPTLLKCNSRPIMSITTDGYVRNQVATVYGGYSQSESLLLKAFKFVLYDVFSHVLEQTDYIYDGSISHTFDYKLVDGEIYFIECVGITQNDLLGTSGLIRVVADYIQPNVYFSLGAETFIDKPFVRLTWTTVRIIGNTTGNVDYVNSNSALDTHEGTVYFDEGFNINEDFTLRLWALDIEDNMELIRMTGSNGNLSVIKYSDRIHVFKKQNGLTVLHIATEPISYAGTGTIYIGLQKIGRNLNIFSEVI